MNKYLHPGLYERLVTLELRKSLSLLKSEQMTLGEADEGDAYVLIAEHLRRIFERTLRSLPESDRVSKQADLWGTRCSPGFTNRCLATLPLATSPPKQGSDLLKRSRYL